MRLREREVAQIRHEAIQAHDLFLHREEPLRCVGSVTPAVMFSSVPCSRARGVRSSCVMLAKIALCAFILRESGRHPIEYLGQAADFIA